MKHIASIFLALVFLTNLASTGFAGSINSLLFGTPELVVYLPSVMR